MRSYTILLFTATKNNKYCKKISTSTHDNTWGTNEKWYTTINYGIMRRDWDEYWVGLCNDWYCRADIGWECMICIPHNNSQFCCKSMCAFWTHNNKHSRDILFTMYGVIMLIQVTQIFVWVGGDHYLVNFYIHNNKVSMWEGTKDPIKQINIHNTSIEHHSVSSISFCSRYAFILRVIHLILSTLESHGKE